MIGAVLVKVGFAQLQCRLSPASNRRHPMRVAFLSTALVLAGAAAPAHAADAIAATTLRMTVTSPDEGVVQSAAKALAGRHYAITMTTSRTDVPETTTWSVTGTRSGAFTEREVRDHTALCTDHAVHGSASCTSELTLKAP